MKIKRSGFLWKWYGFTPFHMWGTFLTGGFISGVGCLALFLAIGVILTRKTLDIGQSEARLIYILIYTSIACTLAALAVWFCSVLMLLFFLGAQKLGVLEPGEKAD